MPITPAQVERRKHYIGASDFAALLGLSPWRTAADVIAEKQGKLEPWAGNDQTDAGNRFEVGVLDEAEARLGPLVRNQFRVFREDGGAPIGSNCDAILVSGEIPVEGKTTGLFGPVRDEWGEEGTDEVPDMYLVQVQAQILCTAADLGHLVAFIGGRGFAQYRIDRNDKLIGVMQEAAAKAWAHVLAGTLPEGEILSLDVAERFRRVPAKTISIPAALKTEWDAAKEAAKAAEEKLDGAKAAILTALGDAEAGEIAEVGMVTYMETERAAYQVAAAKCRTLRFKKLSTKGKRP